ncbi:RNA polymerase factor sigma-54 [Wukongibacter baidiensis]|uniref:RNA polymerase factor sigma-54 n=1 Tax=Wukongibacter baidiensis TaxID=1723361 RepID=UPI003D7F3A9E
MELGYNMHLEQSQKLVITPEMRQAIKILQFNSYELNQFIQEELTTNPTLEIQNGNQESYQEENSLNNERINEKIDWSEYFSEDSYGYNFNTYKENNDDTNKKDFNWFMSEATKLKEHLLFQLQMLELNKIEKVVGKYLIENIDDNGYLNLNIEEIRSKFEVSNNTIQNIINEIQSFDPKGVGGRDLKECLLIQLRENNCYDKVVINIVENFLSELADNKLKYIAKQLDISIKEVQNAMDIIKKLEPKPGRVFSQARDLKYIMPDVAILKRNGEYVVLVNDITSPRLNISKYYKRLITNKDADSETMVYINKKLDSAVRLIKNIEQRRNTIYRVAKEIVEKQIDFFERGKIYLKPMILKDIADEMGVNESTVSRAISGKYVETPKGTFQFKYFFQSGTTKATGEGISSESIKIIIKDMVNNENSLKPFSDQHISAVLNEKGINISRRTVAKYRSELGIPSSTKRRRY